MSAKKKRINRDPVRGPIVLALTVVKHAFLDMQRAKKIADRVDAAVWLISKDATRWFDLGKADQEYWLQRQDKLNDWSWSDYAVSFLAHTPEQRNPYKLTGTQRRLLADGVRYMEREAA